MMLMRSLFPILLLAGLPGGCKTPQVDAKRSEWSILPNAYATHFSILSNGKEHRLIVLGHGGIGDTVGDYLISKPMQRIAIISTTHAAFISALGATDRVIACAQAGEVRDEALRKSIDAGRVKNIGTTDQLDREMLLSLKPDAVLGYPFGGESSTLKNLGIPVMQISEYLEEHPLGRAEWIRFFGVLLGKEQEADERFANIMRQYEVVRGAVERDKMPTVLFGSVWQGQWFVPPGNSYMAKLIEDAGGRYLFADRKGDGNITLDMETMIAEGSQADVWGMITQYNGEVTPSLFTGGDERLEAFKAVRTGRLFIGNSVVSDLFGQAALEPEQVLRDLACRIQPVTCTSDAPMGHYFSGVGAKPGARMKWWPQ